MLCYDGHLLNILNSIIPYDKPSDNQAHYIPGKICTEMYFFQHLMCNVPKKVGMLKDICFFHAYTI